MKQTQTQADAAPASCGQHKCRKCLGSGVVSNAETTCIHCGGQGYTTKTTTKTQADSALRKALTAIASGRLGAHCTIMSSGQMQEVARAALAKHGKGAL